MKSLEALRQDSLQNMEYVTLMRETLADVEATKVELLTTDVPLQNYLGKVKNGIDPFEKMTKNPLKDPLTLHKKTSFGAKEPGSSGKNYIITNCPRIPKN